jgi:7,8-dihydropterin-6-yl-methyl-4-(beta-D-ribofuranosyl)aminobenzene 5'-phosphate synthase
MHFPTLTGPSPGVAAPDLEGGVSLKPTDAEPQVWPEEQAANVTRPASDTAPDANRRITVTVLVNNTVPGRGLRAEHGLAYYVRANGRAMLFDTGQSDLVVTNARCLGLDLRELEAVALSHGHYDHTGGVPAARALAPEARVYLHPAAWAPKFAGNPDGTSREVGMPETSRQALRHRPDLVTPSREKTEVLEGVFLTGEIPRVTSFEDVGGSFFLDDACRQPDLLLDDQALYFDSAEGLVVLMGCGHAGLVNTLLRVEALNPGRRIHAVVGGLHLLEASEARIDATIEAIRDRDIPTLAPAHCTGLAALVRLWSTFPDRVSDVGVGSCFRFNL